MSEDKLMRILVVDDEADITQEYRSILAPPDSVNDGLGVLEEKLFGTGQPVRQKYDLTVCSQGSEAVEAVRQSTEAGKPFSAAFLDMRMPPGPDGLWTAKQIRQIDCDILIAIVTAYTEYEPETIAAQAGPSDRLLYLRKPFTAQEIRYMAQSLCTRWNMEHVQLKFQTALIEHNQVQVKEAVERVDKIRSDFLDIVSHEMRTPLTIFRNAISNTLEQSSHRLGEKDLKNMQIAEREVDRFSKIMNDFIDVSQIDAGAMSLFCTEFNVRTVINQAASKLTKQLNFKNIHLSIDLEPDLKGNGDTARIRRVIISLLDNAIKFAPEKSQIKIKAVKLDESIEISIADNGPGISPNDLPHIFDRFVQAQRLVGAGEHGVGLGLTLSKKIVELHRGQIRVESILGKGSKFSFTVPLEQHVSVQG